MPSTDMLPTTNLTTTARQHRDGSNENPSNQTSDRSVEFQCRMIKVESEYRFDIHKFECRSTFHKSNRPIGYFRVGSKSTEKVEKRQKPKKQKKTRKNGKKLAVRELARCSKDQRNNFPTKHNKAWTNNDDNGGCWSPVVFERSVVDFLHIQQYSCVCTNEKRAVVKFCCRSCHGC